MRDQPDDPGRHGKEYQSLAAALSSATRKIRRAGARNASVACLEQIAISLCYLAVAYITLRVLEPLAGVPARFIVWATLGGVIVVGARASATVFFAWKQTPDLGDVAERLDLAADDANAIATAISLTRDGGRASFELMAISKGKDALLAYALRDPVVNVVRLSIPKVASILGCAALLFAAGVLVPKVDVAGKRDRAELRVAWGNANREPQRRESNNGEDELGDAPHAAPGSRTSGESAKPSNSKDPAGASAVQGAAGRSAAAAAASATAPPPAAKNTRVPNDDGSNSRRETSSHLERVKSTASKPQAASAGAAGAEGAASAAAAGDPAQHSKTLPNVGSPNAEDAMSAAADPPPPADDPQGGAGSVGTPKSRPLLNGGEGTRFKSDGTTARNSGRTAGDDAAKKSRGVAPLLLGTPQPDLLSSRQLIGPDMRSDVKVPPRTDPQSPAPAAPATPRIGEEPAVDAGRVPASARQAVARYFEQFHRTENP